MKYLAGPYRAERANLRGNHLTAGVPSPSAFLGLAGAVARNLGLDGWRLSVVPVLHRVAPSNGRSRGETVIAGSKSSAIMPLEIMEDISGLVEFSMLLDLDGAPDAHAVDAAIMTRRFAGSALFRAGRQDGIRVREANGKAPLRGVPRGRVLAPAIHAPTEVSFGDRSGLEAITTVLYPATAPVQGSGWLVPVAAGYRLLETPAPAGTRRAARSAEHPHAFAEPAVGLGELVSSRGRGPLQTAAGLDGLAWRWAVDPGGDHVMFHPSFLAAAMPGQEHAEERQAT